MNEYTQESIKSDTKSNCWQDKSLESQSLIKLIVSEIQHIIDRKSLEEIIEKILTSKTFLWDVDQHQNKIEVLKWIADFLFDEQRQAFLRYLKETYQGEIKVSKRSIKSNGRLKVLTIKEKKILSFDWEIDIDDIVISGIVGAGSFGSVCSGHLISTGQKVAIKRLSDISEEHIQSFIKEVSILSRLYHPNIVRFLGASLNENMCIIMEFAELGDLKSYLKSNKLTFETKVKFAHEIASGMEYLHGQPVPVVHRDLKCQNILVTEGNILKVSDFGLSKFLDKTVTDGSRIGSLNWLAPEVLRGGPISVKYVDVYAFGMVMYEILMDGSSPYQGIPPIQVIKFIDEGTHPEIPSDCNEVYRDLMLRCWNEDYNSRPSFTDIKNELFLLLMDLRRVSSPLRLSSKSKDEAEIPKRKEKPASLKLRKKKS